VAGAVVSEAAVLAGEAGSGVEGRGVEAREEDGSRNFFVLK
jgi:hypothetical protein